MCWTDSRENKVIFFKEINLWFVSNSKSCSSGAEMISTVTNLYTQSKQKNNIKSMKDQCCMRTSYWNLKHLNFTNS